MTTTCGKWQFFDLSVDSMPAFEAAINLAAIPWCENFVSWTSMCYLWDLFIIQCSLKYSNCPIGGAVPNKFDVNAMHSMWRRWWWWWIDDGDDGELMIVNWWWWWPWWWWWWWWWIDDGDDGDDQRSMASINTIHTCSNAFLGTLLSLKQKEKQK